jgi:hypothetical protein
LISAFVGPPFGHFLGPGGAASAGAGFADAPVADFEDFAETADFLPPVAAGGAGGAVTGFAVPGFATGAFPAFATTPFAAPGFPATGLPAAGFVPAEFAGAGFDGRLAAAAAGRGTGAGSAATEALFFGGVALGGGRFFEGAIGLRSGAVPVGRGG